MHKESEKFFKALKTIYCGSFENARVLDCGSYDVNGTNKPLFHNCMYIGLDVAPGPNVDVVSRIKDFISSEPFDTIISSNTLEHDLEWRESLANMYHLLKVGGLLAISCSGEGTKEHGTFRSSPGASLSHQLWGNYYKNLTEDEIKEALPMDGFSDYQLRTITRSKGMGTDIQFWGIKK